MAVSSHSSTFHTAVFSLKESDGQVRWAKLLKESPQSSPFATLPYVQAIVKHLGVSCDLWFVSDGTVDLISVPVFHKKVGPFKRVIVPAFTPYTSFLFSSNSGSPEPFMLLLNKLADTFDDLRLHLHPSIDDVRSLSWVHWQSAPYYTYQINLASYDPSQSSWSNSARRNFRKHQDDYIFEEKPEFLGRCIELCAAGYARNSRKFPLNPQSLLNLAQDLEAHQMIRTYTVSSRYASTPEAGIVILHDESSAYYWIAGSEPGPAMTVLIGKVLAELKAAGFKQFDFVGANTPSIAEFKRRFGPDLVPYFAALATPNRVLASLLYTKRLFTRS